MFARTRMYAHHARHCLPQASERLEHMAAQCRQLEEHSQVSGVGGRAPVLLPTLHSCKWLGSRACTLCMQANASCAAALPLMALPPGTCAQGLAARLDAATAATSKLQRSYARLQEEHEALVSQASPERP